MVRPKGNHKIYVKTIHVPYSPC